MKSRDKEADLAKVARAWAKQLTDYNYGPLSEKRPLGSSYVEGDILEILKIPGRDEAADDDTSYEDYACELFRELGKFLQQAIARGTKPT